MLKNNYGMGRARNPSQCKEHGPSADIGGYPATNARPRGKVGHCPSIDGSKVNIANRCTKDSILSVKTVRIWGKMRHDGPRGILGLGKARQELAGFRVKGLQVTN